MHWLVGSQRAWRNWILSEENEGRPFDRVSILAARAERGDDGYMLVNRFSALWGTLPSSLTLLYDADDLPEGLVAKARERRELARSILGA